MIATSTKGAAALLASLCVAGGLIAGGVSGRVSHGLAAPASPPPPPAFVPTPIGAPPAPPGASPTSSAAIVIATPTAQSSVTAAPTVAATSSVSEDLQFSLRAARLSKANNPGDLRGLTQVKRGTRVWLMMYYSVSALKKTSRRITRYSIFHGSKLLYRIAFAGTVSKSDVGKSLSRYTVYTVGKTLPYGRYRYRAVLQIGPRHQTKEWAFTVGRADRVATSER